MATQPSSGPAACFVGHWLTDKPVAKLSQSSAVHLGCLQGAGIGAAACSRTSAPGAWQGEVRMAIAKDLDPALFKLEPEPRE